jgi:hypothetical protein
MRLFRALLCVVGDLADTDCRSQGRVFEEANAVGGEGWQGYPECLGVMMCPTVVMLLSPRAWAASR